MNFLSPLMLLGVLGAAIPVVVHLLGRRRAKVVRFAALEFLIGTDKKLAKRLRIRQIGLLLFRVLICLLIPAVLAQPYSSCQSQGPKVTRGPQAVVFIIDDSVASGYRLSGQTLLSRSLASAQSTLEQLGPEAEVALLTTTTTNPGELSRDHLSLRERLARTQVSFDTAKTEDAMQRALQLLTGSNHGKKTLFLFMAPTAASIPATVAPISGTTVHIINAAPTEELPNLAITNLVVHPDPSIGRRGVMVEAEVANYSNSAATATLSLRIGTTVVARGEISLSPGQRSKKRFSAELEKEPRSAAIEVALTPDNFEADDSRYAAADTRDQVPVLLVNGDPRSVRHEDELYYLEAALRPGDRGDSGTKLTSTTSDALQDVDLDAFDTIILANVGSLPEAQIDALELWVKGGGGLLIAVGDKIVAEQYNKTMSALLPQLLQSSLDLKRGRKGDAGHALRLSKLELDHPIFSVFADDAPGLYKASFDKIMLLGPTTDVRDRRVLARFDNGAAALVEAHKGDGLVLLFNSSLDRDWSDLPIHPGFLPFLQQTVRYLAAKPFQRQDRQVLVGDSVSLRVSPDDSRIEIEGPGSSRQVLEGDKLAGRKTARLDSVLTPGIYRVQGIDAQGNVHPKPEAAFAANVDRINSDLSAVDVAHLETSAGAEDGDSESGEHTRRVELWHGIAGLLLLALLLEALVSVYGGRGRRRASNQGLRDLG